MSFAPSTDRWWGFQPKHVSNPESVIQTTIKMNPHLMNMIGVSGADNQDTLTTACNLASVLESQGKYSASEAMYRDVLAKEQAARGSENPDTLTIACNLAGVLESQGKYSAAETMYRKVLAQRNRVLGPQHPNTLSTVNNLAYALNKQGDYAAAEVLFRQVLAVAQEVLGPENPHTLSTRNNLVRQLLQNYLSNSALLLLTWGMGRCIAAVDMGL